MRRNFALYQREKIDFQIVRHSCALNHSLVCTSFEYSFDSLSLFNYLLDEDPIADPLSVF